MYHCTVSCERSNMNNSCISICAYLCHYSRPLLLTPLLAMWLLVRTFKGEKCLSCVLHWFPIIIFKCVCFGFVLVHKWWSPRTNIGYRREIFKTIPHGLKFTWAILIWINTEVNFQSVILTSINGLTWRWQCWGQTKVSIQMSFFLCYFSPFIWVH